MIMIIVFLLGTFFGVILCNGEVISWFRIQEMFRFDSFHMYGVIGSAVVVGALAMILLRKTGIRSATGTPIVIEKKTLGKGTVYGGLLFGAGWALTGACPGPLYALAGSGCVAYAVALVSAIGGALAYGFLRDRLPR